MEDSLISTLSAVPDSIQRPKDKQTRLEIEKLAKDDKQSAPIRLRAFLSIGKMPPPGLATEENILAALNLDDRVNFLSKLAVSAKLIRADAPLRAILRGMKDVGARRSVRITRNLCRTTVKWRKQAAVVTVSDTSVQHIVQILEQVSKYQIVDKSKLPPRKAAKTNPYFQLLSTVTRWTLSSPAPGSLLLVLKLLGSTEERLATSIDKLIDDVEFSGHFQGLITKAVDRCEKLINQSAASEFQDLADAIVKFSTAKVAFKARMAELYSDKARLSDSIQGALRTVLGDTGEVPSFTKIQLDDEDSLRTVQLASALVAAWVAREDGPKAKDAFEELRSVAGNFFNLQLHGNARQIEDYNPRIHELVLGARPSARVRLLGPWVDFSRQTVSKVILKAPVEPA